MPKITDVSPVKNAPAVGHSVIGRMLSVACTPDGKTQYIGSYSNLWVSGDDGKSWEQLTWPQPDPSQFNAPGSLGGWCVMDIATAMGWRVDKHPRLLAQLIPSRTPRLDIVGFGDCGVWTALSNGNGTFQEPRVVLSDFGEQSGGWHVDKHPRFVVDLTGDGAGDIIGFGDAGVWTALGNGDGTFQQPRFALENFGVEQGWRVDRHPRFVVDLDGDGHTDIIGFGDQGVWVALGDGQGGFGDAQFVLENFGYNQSWRVKKHPRFVAKLTNGKFVDIVGFGDAGVWTALGMDKGAFNQANFVLANFGADQSWQVDKHPRFVVDINGDGHADIVGFGDAGVWTALGDGNGGFTVAQFVLNNFGYDQAWRVDKHPRFVANLTSRGFADIVGFGDAGVWTALGTANGGFNAAKFVLANLGFDQGWRVERHPRLIGDLNSDGYADIVGFGDAGVWTALTDGNGGFPTSNFVLPNFGYGTIVLVITRNDLVTGSRGIWRSTDGGSSWTQVLPIAGQDDIGQLQWAPGSDHLVYAAVRRGLAISKDAGATFQMVTPWGIDPAARVNHVAVWQNEGADPFPSVIYAFGDSTMFLSFDGGATWTKDKASLPPRIGGAANSTANFNTPTVMVISPCCPLYIYVTQNGSGGPATLYRGDYTRFFGTQTSTWDTLPLPDIITDPSTQDSGNVFLVATPRGHGNLLFYGAQRFFHTFDRAAAYVGPLEPKSGSDWSPLDVVHVDLHGLCLSPDFDAAIKDGVYEHHRGSMWILSDGGIYRSTNGGMNFKRGKNANTLSSINLAGVALPGRGPAMSLNTGDNDGFYTIDGGQNWSYQEYGGGDNDRSYADPLRPHAMLVATPRWDTSGNIADHTVDGQTVAVYQVSPGNLPNAAQGTGDRRAVTGPPTEVNIWNASSFFGSRGFRPIVYALAGEDSPPQGDYIFVLHPLTQPVLVRTQNIFDIKHREEWITTATGPGQGANVFLQGPPMPTPNPFSMISDPSLGVVQASGGHQSTVFYVSGDGTLWKATADASSWTRIVPAPPNNQSVGANIAVRFFVSPYQSNVVYLLDKDHVKRSDDGGQTWVIDQNLETQLTWNGQIALSINDRSSGVGDFFDLVLTDMQFDPNNPTTRFAVGQGGAFMTTDGVSWTRLLHTGAFPGRPTNCFFDPVSNSADPALYVAFAGRSVVKITELPLNIIL